MEEVWARSLGLKEPLEKEMAAHSSILAWEIWCLVGYSPWGHEGVEHSLVTKQQQWLMTALLFSFVGLFPFISLPTQ